nr:MAG TPA: hypothetical protein [Caudoviricetes sp.]
MTNLLTMALRVCVGVSEILDRKAFLVPPIAPPRRMPRNLLEPRCTTARVLVIDGS